MNMMCAFSTSILSEVIQAGDPTIFILHWQIWMKSYGNSLRTLFFEKRKDISAYAAGILFVGFNGNEENLKKIVNFADEGITYS